MEKRKMDIRIVKYFVLATALILGIRYFDVLLGGAGKLWGIAGPLLMGCVIAYVLNIIMRLLEKIYFPKAKNKFVQKSRRAVCIVLSMVLIAAVVFLVFRLVIPELVSAIGIIGAGIPVLFEQSTDWLAENAEVFPGIAENLQELEIDWNSVGESVINYLQTGVGGLLNSTVSLVVGIVGSVVNFVIALIFAIYILSSKERLADQVKRIVRAYAKPEWMATGKRIIVTADATFSSFIIGQVTEAVILGSLCTVGMLIFGFPYAPMIGAFIGATALIPIVGAYLGAAVGVIMILTQDPFKALLFVVFIVVLQQLEGNLIYPKVVGSSIGLPGIWVLAAVTVGGGLMGISGMLLGVPAAATLYKLLAYDVNERNARRAQGFDGGRKGKPYGGKGQRPDWEKGPRGQRQEGEKPEMPGGVKADNRKGQKPEAPKGTRPEAAKGAKPETVKDTRPEAAKGMKPEAAKGMKPETFKEKKPAAVKGAEPEAPKNARPEKFQSVKPPREKNVRRETAGADKVQPDVPVQ